MTRLGCAAPMVMVMLRMRRMRWQMMMLLLQLLLMLRPWYAAVIILVVIVFVIGSAGVHASGVPHVEAVPIGRMLMLLGRVCGRCCCCR